MRKERARGEGRQRWSAVLADAVARGLCLAEVAAEQGVSKIAVWNACSRRGIKLARQRRSSVVSESVMNEAREAKLRAADVAECLGVTPAAVSRAQHRYGVFLVGAYKGRGR